MQSGHPNGKSVSGGHLDGKPAFCRLFWQDYSGTVRCRIVPEHRLKQRTIKLCQWAFSAGLQDRTFDGAPAWGEVVLEPDWESATPLPYLEKPTIGLWGFFTHKDPSVSPSTHPKCPRTVLKNAVEFAAAKGIRFLVGFEHEFVLLESTNPIRVVAGKGGWSTTANIQAGSRALACLDEIAETLPAMEISIPMVHTESAIGQMEVPLDPLPPLESVDAHLHAREAVVNIASKHGLRATYAPTVTPGQAGNGQHIHISIERDPEEQMLDLDKPIPGGLTARETHFLAGMVEAQPWLLGITMPAGCSYGRMREGMWTGASSACWGIEHHDVPIRLCWDQKSADPSTRTFHIEYRQADITANPWLSVAAIIHAGLRGIETKAKLHPPVPGFLTTMTDSDKAQYGVVKTATSLLDALDTLEQAPSEMIDRISRPVVEEHLRVRRNEYRLWQAMSQEEQVDLALNYY